MNDIFISLRPKRLSTQLILLFSFLLAGSMIVFSFRAAQDMSNQIAGNVKIQAQVLADNLSATGADYLLERDYSAVEQMLMRSIDFPGVISIQVCDKEGKLIGDVIHAQDNKNGEHTEHIARYDTPELIVPANITASITIDSNTMTVWKPVMLGEHLGWVKIIYSLQEISTAEKRVWFNNILLGTIIGFLAIGFIIFMARRPLADLERYTYFADQLNESEGKQLDSINNQSLELEHLGIALNSASKRLNDQSNAIKLAVNELERLAAFPEMNPNIVLSLNVAGELQYLNPYGHYCLKKLEMGLNELTSLLPNNYIDIIQSCIKQEKTYRAIESESHGMTLLWTFAPVSNQDIIHCYALNITKMRNAQEQAKEAELEKTTAVSANKAKSAFLANMSHEIRTPLTAIIGFSESVLEDELSDSQKTDSINIVIRAGKHLLQIINDLLDLSKIEAEKIDIEKMSIPLLPLLNDIQAISSLHAQEKGIDYSIHYNFPLPEAFTNDPLRVKQILLNLGNNAIKFTEKGSVTIDVSYVADSRQLKFEINDTGIGIKQENLNKLFQPFVQADSSTTRKFGGTGLGLHLSKLLAEKMGGTITATSEHGHGSCFTCLISVGDIENIKMLAAMPDAVILQNTTISEPVQNKLSGQVLLVEDNSDNQKLISLYLRKLGATVDIADNGAIGVGLALNKKYDLILMDMQMPVMDGFEATGSLRQTGCTTPIVALTASTMQSEIQNCLDAGCDDFLAKPIDRIKFNSYISQYLHTAEITSSDHTPLISSILENDPDFAELVEEFISGLPNMIDKLKFLVDKQDWLEFKARVHELKGMGGSFGFPQLTEVAQLIEKETATQSYSALIPLIDDLQRLLIRIQAGFK